MELNAGETEVALTEEERLYEDAKRRYERAGRRFDEAEEALEQWKVNHAGYGPLDAELLQLQKNVNDTAHLLQITDQALQNARAAVGLSGHLSVPPRDRQLDVGGVNFLVTQTMSLNPPALVQFWEAFRKDQTKVEADALIELPEGTYLMGDSTVGSRIYIRHCYPELWKLCQQLIHDEAMNTPLGNPGIGKTFFGFVILLLLARDGATVVCESGILKQCYLFTNEMVVEGAQNDFVQILKNPGTY